MMVDEAAKHFIGEVNRLLEGHDPAEIMAEVKQLLWERHDIEAGSFLWTLGKSLQLSYRKMLESRHD